MASSEPNRWRHTINLEPVPMKAVRFGNNKTARKAQSVRLYQAKVRQALAEVDHPHWPEGALQLDLLFILDKGDGTTAGPEPWPGVPDLDNLRKATQDALAPLWGDDRQVVAGLTLKAAVEAQGRPRVVLSVRPMNQWRWVALLDWIGEGAE